MDTWYTSVLPCMGPSRTGLGCLLLAEFLYCKCIDIEGEPLVTRLSLFFVFLPNPSSFCNI